MVVLASEAGLKACVVGGGSWGTTLARLLALKGYDAALWTRSEAFAEELRSRRENLKYLPGIQLPENLRIVSDDRSPLESADLVVFALPSHSFRPTVNALAGSVRNDAILLSATKGLEQGSDKLMTDILSEELPGRTTAAISGPNLAEEVSKGIPTATVISSGDDDAMALLASIFATGSFRTYSNPDLRGVQICGALKNVIAIGAGVGDGLGFGENAKATIITRGMKELSSFGRLVGAKEDTFFGLAGMGDLIATCISKHSRNRRFGEMLGRGLSPAEAMDKMGGMVVEGATSSMAIEEISRKHGVKYTIPHEVYNVLYEGKDPQFIVGELMSRAPKVEM